MQTFAKQVSHGVIEIAATPAFTPAAPSFQPAPVSSQSHPITVGVAPEPVIQHKTTAQIEAEAAQIATDVAESQTK